MDVRQEVDIDPAVEGRWKRIVGAGLTGPGAPHKVGRVAPNRSESSGAVRARNLRTQQRAESQCQINAQPRARPVWPAEFGFL